MAKSQLRSSKEPKKPKKAKPLVVQPAVMPGMPQPSRPHRVKH